METEKPFSQPELTWDYSDPVNGPTIPAPFFYDSSIFAEEKKRIFMKAWHYYLFYYVFYSFFVINVRFYAIFCILFNEKST